MHHHGASTKKRVEEFGSPLWNANRIAFFRKQHGWLAAQAVRGMLLVSLVCMFFRILFGRRSWAEKREVLGRFGVFARRSLTGARS